MGAFFGIAYVLGAIISIWTLQSRAGLNAWWGMPVSQILVSPEWFVVLAGKAFGWPVTLLIWQAQGRPPSPWGVKAGSRNGRITRIPPADRINRDQGGQ